MATAGATATGRGSAPAAPADSPLERLFGLRAAGATPGSEIRAGATTFLVMAYIIFVNPAILSFAGIPALEGQGPPFAVQWSPPPASSPA